MSHSYRMMCTYSFTAPFMCVAPLKYSLTVCLPRGKWTTTIGFWILPNKRHIKGKVEGKKGCFQQTGQEGHVQVDRAYTVPSMYFSVYKETEGLLSICLSVSLPMSPSVSQPQFLPQWSLLLALFQFVCVWMDIYFDRRLYMISVRDQTAWGKRQ